MLAATNGDLWQRIEAGDFREDLFWRLAVGIISIPPLRERREDIPRLAEHFAQQCAPPSSSNGEAAPLRFSREAMEVLVTADWPGNVRQLEYLVHRINMGQTDRSRPVGRRTVEHEMERFIGRTRRGRREPRELCTLREMEEQQISRALRATRGNTKRASELLGIGRSTLYRKLREYKIRLSGFVPEHSLS